MSTIPRPYAKTTRDGRTIDQLTNYALYATEAELGYARGSLTVVQGSYNAGGVSASAGTHDGGGVVDLTAAEWQNKVHALRKVGFAAWHRPPNWDGRGGGEHIHAVLIGNRKLSPSAAAQVVQYRNRENGLASHGADPTWRPNPLPAFVMPARPVPKRLVFHIHKGQFYYVEDSWRGGLLALLRHFGWIDWDCQITSDGVLIIAHGPRPLADNTRGGFIDPKGLIRKSATYDELTWEEVSRLRSKTGGYRIRRADELVPMAIARGLKVELELKSTKIKRHHLADLRKHLSDPSMVQVKALPDFYTALQGAREAGYVTIILGHHNPRIPAEAQTFITYRRGQVNWQ